jgi:hypothetical protein
LKRLFFLIPIIFVVICSCEDILWTDGRTEVRGFVIDTLSNTKVKDASVVLYECYSGLFARRCYDVVERTRTNSDGYYSIKFKDMRKKNFFVALEEEDILQYKILNNLLYQAVWAGLH